MRLLVEAGDLTIGGDGGDAVPDLLDRPLGVGLDRAESRQRTQAISEQ